MALLASPHWTSQSSYEAEASLLPALSVWAVLMSLYSIATEYNGPSEASHAHIDFDSYDTGECGVAGQLRLDLLDQLGGHGSSIELVLSPPSVMGHHWRLCAF